MRLYSVTKAAEIIGISRHWLSKGLNSGEFPSFKVLGSKANSHVLSDDHLDCIRYRLKR